MEIEIDSKRNNPLLNRTEIYFTIKHEGEGTPNREIIRSELADKLNVKKENIIVNTVHSSFGIHEISGYAKIYTSQEKSKNLERDFILRRNKLIEAKGKKPKGEEKPPAAPKSEVGEEKPTEEPVEKTKEIKEEKNEQETVGKPDETKEPEDKSVEAPKETEKPSKEEETPKEETKQVTPEAEKPQKDIKESDETSEQPAKEKKEET